MLTQHELIAAIEHALAAKIEDRRVAKDIVEYELVVHNASNNCAILAAADRLKTKKPDIVGMNKLIHNSYVRRQVIAHLSTIPDPGDVVYKKFSVAKPVYLTDSIRLNAKAEQIVKTDPIDTPELIRAMYRIKYKFNGFVADISFVSQQEIKNARSYKDRLRSAWKELGDTIGLSRLKKLKSGKSIDCLLADAYTAVPTVRVEIEFEFIPSEKIDFDTLMVLLRAADKDVITPLPTFDNYLSSLSARFDTTPRGLYNKPIDLTRPDLPTLKSVDGDPKGFAVSYKKDGIRVMIMINALGNVLIGHKPQGDVFRLPDSVIEDAPAVSIIDAEFIEATGQYFAFDIAIFRGTFADRMTFPARLKSLNQIVAEDLSDIMPIDVTDFEIPNATRTLSNIAKTLLARQKKLLADGDAPFAIDGLIYTPVRGTYTDTILRWKPENTIDFVVDFEKVYRKRFRYILYSHAGSLLSRPPDGVTNTEIFNEYKTERFTIFKPVDSSVNRYLSPTRLDDHAIYEFAWRNKKWVMLRKRDDKAVPNFVNTARAIFAENILNPVLESEITDLPKVKTDAEMPGIYFGNVGNVNRHKLMHAAASFHNAIKGSVYNETILPGTRLLDIGSGRANDLHRWKSKRLSAIIGVEYNADNIAQATERIASSAPSLPVTFYNFGFFEWFNSKRAEWKKYSASGSNFNYVTVFFSGHYFLQNEKSYEQFFVNISKVLTKLGKVIVIDLDGKTIFKHLLAAGINKKSGKYRFGLEPTPTLDPSAYVFEMDPAQFKKKPKAADFRPGIKVSAYVSTIGTINDEYLLDIDQFIAAGEKKQFQLVKKISFGNYRRQLSRPTTIRAEALRKISYSNTIIVLNYNPT